MFTIVTWILKLFLFFLLFLVILCTLLIILPVRYNFVIDMKYVDMSVKLLYGLVRVRYSNKNDMSDFRPEFNFFGFTFKIKQRDVTHDKVCKKKHEPRENYEPSERFAFLKNFDSVLYEKIKLVIEPTALFIKDIFKYLHPNKILISGDVGFDDPSMTGYVSGFVSMFYFLPRFHFDINWNFQKPVFYLHSEIAGKTYAFKFLFSVVKYILNDSVRDLILLKK